MKKKMIFPILVLVLLLSMTFPMATALANGPYDYYIAAHAVVVKDGQEETAWADCNNSEQFNDGGSWAFCFGYPYGDNHWWGLYVGRDHTFIGWVKVYLINNETRVRIIWEITEPGWEIIETHIAIEDLKENIPQNEKGNPKVGQFAIGGQRTGETFSTGIRYIVRVYDL